MNKTKIEWCDYTWNPVVGCKHGCSYCYGKRMNQRFKWIESYDQPKFYPERLDDPIKLKKPSTIFVVSMGDLFGDWVPDSWIYEIINITDIADHHKYMFLTKNPSKYFNYINDFQKHCWLGMTAENGERFNQITRIAIKVKWPWIMPMMEVLHDKGFKTFISIEPLLGDFKGIDLSPFDLIIIGAMTGQKAIKPKQEWIRSIKHENIFFKDNIKPYVGDTLYTQK